MPVEVSTCLEHVRTWLKRCVDENEDVSAVESDMAVGFVGLGNAPASPAQFP
jgi:hypothetical protein